MASGSFSEDIPLAGSKSTPDNIVLHVLCPSLPPPNRFTFNELSLSTTVAALKVRISQSIPSQPPPETQRLIFRGKPLSNDGMTLQGLLEPVSESEYSMHLVLPPAPLPAATASRFSSSIPGNSNGTPVEQNPLLSSRFAPPNHTQNAQGIRYRGAVPSPVASEAEIGLALRRNIEALRRQIELQERRGPLGQQEAAITTSSSLFASNPLSPPFAQQHAQHPSSTITSTHFSMPSDTSGSSSSIRDQNASANLSEDYRLRLQILRQQIALGEEQLNRGIAPPIDHIIRIRTQLFQLLDDLYRNPLSERDGSIESLLTRIFNIYTRADQVRVTRSRSPGTLQNGIIHPPAGLEHTRAPLYLLSSPDGYQALVSPPGAAETIQTSLNALRATQTPATSTANAHGHGQGQDMHPNPDAVVMENAVRQAALNPRVVNNEQGGMGRHFRRVWLFIRLYFFCYMFSEPGTWTRVFFVALAVIISLLSETSVPQQLYGMTIAPVQRHLEGLVHFPPDEHPQQRPHATGSAAGPAAANRPGGPGPAHGTFPTQLRHNFRRVERSLALFIASLVPGVGERHIEARNAAEAARNAELAREEERRRQEEANNAEGNTEHRQNQEEDGASARPELTEQHTTTENEFNATIPREDENGAR